MSARTDIEGLRDELEAFRNGERRDWGQVRHYVDRVAARLEDAKRRAKNDDALLRYERRKRKAAEARVAALTGLLDRIVNAYTAEAEDHNDGEFALWNADDLVNAIVDARAALAAADRPEDVIVVPPRATEDEFASLPILDLSEILADRPEGTAP